MKTSRFYCGVLVGALSVMAPIFLCEACGAFAPKAVDCRVEWDKIALEAGCARDAAAE